MKTFTNRVVLVLTVALCAVAAQAQSRTMLRGTVPFNFTVGDRSLPSGEYTIKAVDQNIEAWYDPNGRGLFMVRTIPMGKEAEMSVTKLVFHRYGDTYLLAEVWSEGVSHQVKFGAHQQRIAKLNSHYETIAVLMTSHR